MYAKVAREGEEGTAKSEIGTASEEEVAEIVNVMAVVEIGTVVEVDGIVMIRTIETVGVVTETVEAVETGIAKAVVISAEAVTIEMVDVVIVVVVVAAARTEPLDSVVISYKITVKYVLALLGKTLREFFFVECFLNKVVLLEYSRIVH